MSVEPTGVPTSSLSARYRIERELGRGGMATVLLATDLQLARPVAIKLLDAHRGDAEGADRFRREIALASQLQHANVVPVFDSGVVDGTPFFVMPFVEGETLRARLAREGTLPLADVLALVEDIAAGLDHAHAHGVVHRDVKPENVLLSGGRALVADFGVALPADAIAERLTATGLVVGTPAYMSPEQALGDRTIDHRSDIYALGCVVYEALAGHPPFSGASLRELVARHIADPPPPLRAARPDLPAAVEQAVLHALAKAPADRPSSAGALAAELRKASTGVVTAAAHPRRRRWMVGVAAGGVAAALVAIVMASTAANAFEARDRIVLSDVVITPADAALSDALRSALGVALEQSAHVIVLHRQVMGSTLRAMRLPDSVRINHDVARDVAVRTGTKAVLVPTIRREGAGWHVELLAEVATSRRPLALVRGTAVDDAALITTLGGLAGQLRRALGEPLRKGEEGLGLEAATTSSLEALLSWNEGVRLFRAGQYQPAAAAFRSAVAQDSLFAMAHKSLGVTLYWLGQRLAGDSSFARALALRDRLTVREQLMIEADIATWRNEGERAAQLLLRLLERFPDDREARRALAYGYLRSGELDASAAQYAELIRTDSNDFNLRVNLATALSAAGRGRESVPHYRAAFAIEPERLFSGQPLVQEYVMTVADAGERDSAFALARRIVEAGGFSPRLGLRLLGMLEIRDGRVDAAADALREAWVRSAPSIATTARNAVALAWVLHLGGRDAEARRVLRTVRPVGLDPQLEPAWSERLGHVAWLAGDAALAREFDQRTIALANPVNLLDRANAHLSRSRLALARGDAGAALAAADSALALSPRSALAVLTRARAIEASGEQREAERRYLDAAGLRSCCYEEYFFTTAARIAAARLAVARADTLEALRYLEPLLSAWRRGDTSVVAHRWAIGLRRE